ncbi:MAG: LysE family transporter [Proteobacteria bacterium]|nr:LysE family transporter [Pseudomonadota bacterium]
MLNAIFVKGMIVGLMIAAPVGPINVLCARRTLLHGRLVGFVSGLGAAAADTIFGAIAAFGLAFIMGFLLTKRIWFEVGGSAVLIVIGVRILMSHAPNPNATPDPTNLIGDFTSTFLLTLTNPVTIISFLAVFAGLGIQGEDSVELADGLLLLFGVFLGSSAWWLVLTTLVSVFHGRFTEAGLRWANRTAGAVVLAFAVALLWAAVQTRL